MVHTRLSVNFHSCILGGLGRTYGHRKLGGNQWVRQSESVSRLKDLVNRNFVVDYPAYEEPPELRGLLLSPLNLSTLSQSLFDLIEETETMIAQCESESGGESVNQSLEIMTTGPHGVDTRNNNNPLNSSSSLFGESGESTNEEDDDEEHGRAGPGGKCLVYTPLFYKVEVIRRRKQAVLYEYIRLIALSLSLVGPRNYKETEQTTTDRTFLFYCLEG